MPTYEYVCDDGHRSEVRQAMSDGPLERCPVDGCDAGAERMIGGGVAVHSGSDGRAAPSSGAECGPSGPT